MPKHDGITAFVMPMEHPGVTVRPLRQITGDAEFCEVFFDDARIDDSMRLGPVDEGWRVAISVLMNERQSISAGDAALPGTVTGRSVAGLIERHAPVADPVVRQRLAQAVHRGPAREDDEPARGGPAPRRSDRRARRRRSRSSSSASTPNACRALAVDLEGPAAQAWPDGDRWLQNTAWSFLRVRSKTIAGGTSEVQRNILGERVLGLPKEPELDRSVPWSEVRRS